MKPQKHQQAKDVTAQPRSLRDELPNDRAEEGLSIDPEEMGESFLRYATEQGNVEDGGVPELHVDGAPSSDAAQPGSHFYADASVWENTVGMVQERGNVDDVTGEVAPPIPELGEDEVEQPERGVLEVDLTESVIEEASLLDEESSVLGETIPKEPRTEDTGPRRRVRPER